MSKAHRLSAFRESTVSLSRTHRAFILIVVKQIWRTRWFLVWILMSWFLTTTVGLHNHSFLSSILNLKILPIRPRKQLPLESEIKRNHSGWWLRWSASPHTAAQALIENTWTPCVQHTQKYIEWPSRTGERDTQRDREREEEEETVNEAQVDTKLLNNDGLEQY